MDTQAISLEQLTVSTEAQRYPEFFRQRGAFKVEHFINPRLNSATVFELPMSSIMHYIADSDVELGPNPNHLFLRKATGRLMCDNVFELATRLGAPIQEPGVVPSTLVEKYKRQYRTIRPLRDLNTAVRDTRTVVISNYAMLNHLYRYRVTFQARLFKFQNMLNTLVANVEKLAKNAPTHQQYLPVTLPKTIPTKQQFVLGNGNLDRNRMAMFPDDHALFLLELWKWIGVNRDSSLLSKLSDEALSKLNLVFQVPGKWCILNLGTLDGWRRKPEVKGSKGYSPQQMQVGMYLKFLDSLDAARSVGADNVVVTKTPAGKDANASEAEIEDNALLQVVSEGEAIQELKDLETDAAKVPASSDLDVQTTFSPLDIAPVDIEPPTDDDSPAPVQGVQKRIEELATDGRLSTAEQRYYNQKANSYKSIQSPYGKGTLEELATITDGDLELRPYRIEDIGIVRDKSMLESSLKPYFQKYLAEGILQKDIAAAILSAQNAGVPVTDYRVEKVIDAMNKYEIHSVEFSPVGGSKSTWRFKLPAFDKNGVMQSAGVRYRLRSQRGDIPIRKTKAHEVVLSSYYPVSKLFVRRSQKKVDDYGAWLGNQCVIASEAKDIISEATYGFSFSREYKVPRVHSILSTRFKYLKIGNLPINLDPKMLLDSLGISDTKEYSKLVDKYGANGEMIVGKVGKDNLLIAAAGHFYNETTGEVYGTIEELLKLDSTHAPVDCAVVSVMGKDIPIAMFLGQRYGMSTLLRRLKIPHRFVVRGSRMELRPGEYAVRFKDQSLIVNREYALGSLVVASLNNYHKAVEEYDYAEFDGKDVYGAVYMKMGLTARYSREIDNMFDMYIDHITKGLLNEMKEPDRFGPLLLRAVELLTTDQHPRDVDGDLLRIRGYERVAGRVYREMCKGIRQYRDKPLTSKSKVEINPFEVWTTLTKDSAMTVTEDINPLHSLKERANVTYAGTDGKSSRTMVRRNREYDPADMGVISEATVDNGDVAVTVFMSSNPQLATLRGRTKDIERSKEYFKKNPSHLLSPVAMVSQAVTYDDPKRANFASVQASHIRAAEGYQVCPYLTGGELTMAHDVPDIFASTAVAKGKVTEVSEKHLRIVYDDETLEPLTVELGRRYGVSAGTTIPHDIMTDLKVGDKVTKDTVVAWNSGFFARVPYAPGQVAYKNGVLMDVAFLESPGTYEDSCEVSASANMKMTIPTSEVRDITVTKDQSIHRLVTVGDELDADSILCNIEDQVTAVGDLFNEQSLDTLKASSRNSPRSRYVGTVSRVEVLYNVDLDDETETVSQSIRKLIMDADKERARLVRLLKNGDATTGLCTEDIEPGTIVIKVYIDNRLGAGDGDKFVFGNQMKSVSRRELFGTNETEDGRQVDAYFSYTSVDNRQVHSPQIMGTTIPLIEEANRRAARAYRA